jgi:hypothetical protein
MIPLVLAVHAADLGFTLAAVAAHGTDVEANPAVRAALELGPLGGVAFKAALLAVILAAAALNRRYRRLLLWGALIGGLVGTVSGLLAL